MSKKNQKLAEARTDSAFKISELLELVSFKIGNEEFAVEISNVKEIIKMLLITKVPDSPDFVEGVINLRGSVTPVINLRSRLGIERKKKDEDTRIIVVELNKKTIGFIVDEVCEVFRIPASITEAPPEMVTGCNSDFIQSVGKLEDRLLILIDLSKIITTKENEELSVAA